ncbi:MAG TPA: Hsp33 family molecular chaperone HslO [Candidatus Avacidaminococcus intestinavium]|uniref:33 kDa chaperonin n=1 Tax=Candidatus Avacidaminococcus intestinavium TaxID=2840684 RepID=A0A9D1MPG4_9FIRM|nr:Hsp33 family molecular chaperone HslO [Candidatus Avacidaminococcus intestinavium]
MKDYLVKATAEGARIYALTSTELTAEVCRNHGCSHLASAALGRAMNGALLLAAMMKEEERITLRFAGDGPLGSVVADAEGNKVRGYVDNPNAFLPLKNGKLDVGGGVGQGNLVVTRFLANAEPFNGYCEITDGEIASDLTNYLYTSEQTPSSVALGVLVNPEGSIVASGGWFIQAMPGCSKEVLTTLENNVLTMPYVTELLNSDHTPEAIIGIITKGLQVDIKEKEPVEFACRCNRERVRGMLMGLPQEDLIEMEEDTTSEIHCQFCNKLYQFTPEEIGRIVDEKNA